METKTSFMSRLIEAFLKGNFAILLIVVSLIAGAIALTATPREEEPQIVVPLADVLIMYPGGSAEEVEQMVSSRLERMLYQIDGVEYVYSMSRPGMAVVTVRFFVGQDREESLIKLYNKIFQNIDKTTPGIAGWVVKPIEIDDVPIVSAALYSDQADSYALRRVAEEVVDKLQHIPDSANITIYGGERRTVQVHPDMERLAAYGLSAMEIAGALKVSNAQMESGSFSQGNRSYVVEAGTFLQSADEVKNLMVGIHENRPVYLRDVAEVTDGPEEVSSLTRIGFGVSETHVGKSFPSVTIAVAKKKGSNAVWVARKVEAMLQELRGRVIPDNVQVRITRNYGETANAKVNDLVANLGMGILTVVGLIALSMSWREGAIVGLTIPITYSLTLLFNYLFGYTINRVTLFALILALGLLVDNPIVSVENITRYLSMKKFSRDEAISRAMNEVMPPIVLATLAIIVSFIPMFFISGMMGPYMGPMALNVPLTMLSSMLVAFAITPWLAKKLLKDTPSEEKAYDIRTTKTFAVYHRVLAPFVDSRGKSLALMGLVVVLFAGSVALALTGLAPLKMLPFDNKNEFQLVVDMPEGSTLEATDGVVRKLEDYVRTIPEMVDFTSTVGIGSPMDFNGLVRHYYLRQGPNVADIRINLLHRTKRAMDSHAITLRIRKDIEALAAAAGARIKIVEAPPGPPVLSTVVAEIYGQPYHRYDELIAAAETVQAQMRQEQGVVDIDDTVEANQQKLFFRVDREKAGLSGISTEDIVNTLRLSLAGMPAGTVHVPTEQNELPIVLRLSRAQRSDPALLQTIQVKGRMGQAVQLGELGRFEENVQDKTIFHKNLQRVVFVTAEMAGRGPAYAVLELQKHFTKNPLPNGIHADWSGEGEWKITIDVFRDLGIAFSVALLAIYILLVYETGSYLLPLVIMMSIPLTLIGIMPGFWLLNVLVNRPIGGFENPVFFTATAMIGMIALGGIVQRNAIILIDFIRTNMERGATLRDSLLESGAVRFRPIFLTAGTTLLGAWPITFDPIFSGLAWSIIFGLFVSTAFTLVVIPVVYMLVYGREGRKEGRSDQ
ncbi:MAG TPA: AcrB/AcrD/AcrF family protein [Verrucomicrobia bacterium]|nr:MAG: acriflavine resistance protein B [Lentisphaerae bacterium GWF2_57_35]HBA82979.1 AcrB/AcrD/AcrF family protein [Verrucomicrobiota bacterium]